MLESELCSARVLSPFREESGDEELSVLPRHTKVIVTGNNRTKSVLVGLQGVVKKAVGLGGWHWLGLGFIFSPRLKVAVSSHNSSCSQSSMSNQVLKNGVEVKLQRNALSVLEHPTGNEVDEDDFDNSSSGSDICEKDHDFSSGIEFHRLSKPRVRQTRPWIPSSSTKTNRSSYRDVQSIIHAPQPKVNLAKLETSSLGRYCKHFNLAGIGSDSSREQMLRAAQKHFISQVRCNEAQVISEFIVAAKRLKKSGQ
ncbi:uncharacterized protein LOC110806496 isoform X1 [Carica papaya]|uniref:uncharacterized protein LOC110806496 isoform X1 n=1 Tax=Carica papaya TaxID=3649 RepID=UPI000B8C84B0|nr:uncharacterized protein LOC110806496 isoform X1 [Carica papaya]XP_021887078.1 uncharacterized protein LOC110806496 isoform X1 [Carica papaya]XP_021887079.1 uncharacterized protein LOC110806496 isoform X1 [Carica papaya]